MTENGFGCRPPVGGEFHHKRNIIAVYQQFTEHPRQNDGKKNAYGVDDEQDEAGIMREECTDQYKVDRQAGTA